MYHLILILIVLSTALPAQELRTTRLEVHGSAWDGTQGGFIGTREVIPLVLGTTNAVAQPIRFLVGAAGSTRAMEIDGTGGTWLRGPVAIGPSTGAIAGVLQRSAGVAEGGIGHQIDLVGTRQATGLTVDRIGVSGSDHAGIVLTSQANGTGTGLRIGGPVGSSRPTLSTGIDITGGTGLRYNALTAGQGTAIEIGGTLAPQRGIDVRVSGTQQVGLFARSNTLGSGIVGMSASGAYADVSIPLNAGVVGVAASNSNATADTVVGMRAHGQRGGSGGRSTTTIGLRAQAVSEGTQHAGTAVGLLAEGASRAPGVAVSIGACLRSVEGGLALVALDGDVYLGSADDQRPPQLSASTINGSGGSTTHLYHVRSSGDVHHTGAADLQLPQGITASMASTIGSVLRVLPDATGSEVHGLSGGTPGRLITIVSTGAGLLMVDGGGQAPVGDRFTLPDHADVVVPANGSITLWYDADLGGWRCIGRSW